jgi:hypothetical protein
MPSPFSGDPHEALRSPDRSRFDCRRRDARCQPCAGTGAKPNGACDGNETDRTTADAATRKAMREKENALRQKRAGCRKEARQQKIALLKRHAFVKACMSR